MDGRTTQDELAALRTQLAEQALCLSLRAALGAELHRERHFRAALAAETLLRRGLAAFGAELRPTSLRAAVAALDGDGPIDQLLARGGGVVDRLVRPLNLGRERD